MFPQQHSILNARSALLAVALVAFPLTGHCIAAGHADFVIGNVEAVAPDGARRTLTKGAEINAGESVNTAAGARAQIRFTDGGYVSLQPNTLFRLDEYHYENKKDGTERSFFSLLKGGLRTITGLVGRINRDNYKLVTPVATIGIRGTGYNAVLGEGLVVSVSDGIISLTNKGGTLVLSQGQSAFVADINTVPSLTFEKPATPPPPLSGTGSPAPAEEQYVQGDCIGTCGGGGLPPSAGLTVITGVAAAFSGSVVDPQQSGLDYPGIVSFDPVLGSEVSYVDTFGATTSFAGATLDTSVNNGFPASGFDGTVGWGRFYGTATLTEGGLVTTKVFGPDQGLHSVVGIPTAAMPTTGFATYSLAGATRPTLDSGAWTAGAVTGGSMSVDFFSATPFVSGGLQFTMNATSFNMSFSGNVSGGNRFSGLTGSVSSTSGACVSTGCTPSVNGFFAGTNAGKAGISYEINGGGLPSTVRGAAVYTQTSYSPLGVF